MANHFNNSLTVKRIEMMRTIKTNIKEWKLAALAALLPAVFFLIACQDQIGDDLTKITQNSSHALIVPEHVKSRFEQLQKEHPEKRFVVLELNETASQKLEALKDQYGLPAAMEVFKTVGGKPVAESVRGEAANITIERTAAPPAEGLSANSDTRTRNGGKRPNGEQTFAIVEFNSEATRISETAAQEEKIFTVVEHQPEFPGGHDALVAFIRGNLRYPAEARRQGIEGTVYASFIVELDGSVSSVNIVKGISPDCDAEVKRMVEAFPKWTPGKQSGREVRVRFVVPVKFAL